MVTGKAVQSLWLNAWPQQRDRESVTTPSRQPAMILLLAFCLNESLQYFKHAFDPLEHVTATINTSTS